MFKRIWLWAPPALDTLLIFNLSSEANPLPGLTTLVWDKALHATEYAGLAFLVFRALRGEGMRSGRAVVVALLATSAYGGSDEIHQYFVPGRDSEVSDWIADTVGGSIGISISAVVLGLWNARFRPTPPTL